MAKEVDLRTSGEIISRKGGQVEVLDFSAGLKLVLQALELRTRVVALALNHTSRFTIGVPPLERVVEVLNTDTKEERLLGALVAQCRARGAARGSLDMRRVIFDLIMEITSYHSPDELRAELNGMQIGRIVELLTAFVHGKKAATLS